MKFSESIEIDQSADMVAELFANPSHLDQWMDGLQNIAQLKWHPRIKGSYIPPYISNR